MRIIDHTIYVNDGPDGQEQKYTVDVEIICYDSGYEFIWHDIVGPDGRQWKSDGFVFYLAGYDYDIEEELVNMFEERFIERVSDQYDASKEAACLLQDPGDVDDRLLDLDLRYG